MRLRSRRSRRADPGGSYVGSFGKALNYRNWAKHLILLVGVAGFESSTPLVPNEVLYQ